MTPFLLALQIVLLVAGGDCASGSAGPTVKPAGPAEKHRAGEDLESLTPIAVHPSNQDLEHSAEPGLTTRSLLPRRQLLETPGPAASYLLQQNGEADRRIESQVFAPSDSRAAVMTH